MNLKRVSNGLIKFFLRLLALSTLLILLLPVVVEAQSVQNTNFIPSSEIICGGSCPLIDGDFNPTADSIANFILSLARFLTFVGGALTVLFIVYGGLLVMTDFGGGERSKAGWNCIKTSIVGLVIIIVAYTVVAFIGSFLTGSNFGDIISTVRG
ncbi:MAG: hypothetical protein AAGF07_01520 [Patescibacteria group bacterium]